jgi:hypothetical protein
MACIAKDGCVDALMVLLLLCSIAKSILGAFAIASYARALLQHGS